VPNAAKWLISRQEKDGSWHPHYGADYESTTGYVAYTLIKSKEYFKQASLLDSVGRAKKYLDIPGMLTDPYALAELALIMKESGDDRKAAEITNKLSDLAQPEKGGYFWALTTNTPFYGWGRAGRIETTAMVALALSSIDPNSEKSRKLVKGATLWLISEKDRYGVWYSGQATTVVLSSILQGFINKSVDSSGASLSILVNDRPVALNAQAMQSDAPVIVDISGLVKAGGNTIEIKAIGKSAAASIQAVAEYYVPWNGDAAREAIRPGKTEALKLAVKFDKTEAKTGDSISCSVEAERIGHYGWGMMIAEVGLPPGADVDRNSLEEAKTKLAVSKYEILPDRVILYLWPNAGGVNVNFSFRPRYGMKARSAPSVLYDYYNPDARVFLPPADFTVH
jgi:hypothetical protein